MADKKNEDMDVDINNVNIQDLAIGQLIHVLENEKAIRRKPPTLEDGSSVLVSLKQRANQVGLTSEQIVHLTKICTCKKFVDAIINQIIKCLIPRDKVSADCVIDLFSKMCANVISTNIQVSFLKWIIMVYEWIEDKNMFHCLYGLIFLFLDNDTLCPYICNVLYLMTRKDDVKSFRIRKLLDLLGKVGHQSHIIGLLSLYKVHSPHLVSVNIPGMRKAFFKRKDSKWLDIVWNVKSSYQAKNTKEPKSTLENESQNVVSWQWSKKRRKDIVIPSIRNYHKTQNEVKRKVTLNEITCFDGFLSHIDHLEFPNQMGCILECQYLQHYLTITRDESALIRMNFWLHQTLYEELVSAPSGVVRDRVTKLLQALVDFQTVYQKPLSSLEICLAQYLLTWNGVDYQTLVLLLVSQLQVRPFQKLNDLVLEPLRKLFFCSSVEFKCQVLSCFTEMLMTFARSAMKYCIEEENKSVQTSPACQSSDIHDFTNERREICKVMLHLVEYVDKISTVVLQIENDNILLQHCLLQFFEQVSKLHLRFPAVNFVYTPLPSIVYRFTFASNPMVVSRFCNIMVDVKDTFELMKRANVEEIFYGFEKVNLFNRYILDICDTIWRNKAFEDRSQSLCYSIERRITESLEIPHINERFSVVNHAAFIYLAKTFLEQTQDKDTKLDPNLIRLSEICVKISIKDYSTSEIILALHWS